MSRVDVVASEAVVAGARGSRLAEVALTISAVDLGAGGLGCVGFVAELAVETGGGGVAEVAEGDGRAVDLGAGDSIVEGVIAGIAGGAALPRVVEQGAVRDGGVSEEGERNYGE